MTTPSFQGGQTTVGAVVLCTALAVVGTLGGAGLNGWFNERHVSQQAHNAFAGARQKERDDAYLTFVSKADRFKSAGDKLSQKLEPGVKEALNAVTLLGDRDVTEQATAMINWASSQNSKADKYYDLDLAAFFKAAQAEAAAQ